MVTGAALLDRRPPHYWTGVHTASIDEILLERRYIKHGAVQSQATIPKPDVGAQERLVPLELVQVAICIKSAMFPHYGIPFPRLE